MQAFAAITPHPPIILPGVGMPEDLKSVQGTIQAMQQLGQDLAQVNPDLIIVISPHAPIQPASFGANNSLPLQGSLKEYGLSQQFCLPNYPRFTNELKSQTRTSHTPLYFFERKLDHGVLVPLFYLANGQEKPLVHLSLSMLNLQSHFEFGQLLGRLIEASSKKVAIIASGDLSHRLIPGAPAGYSPMGSKFDQTLTELLKAGETQKILSLDPRFVAEAGECGLRSAVMLLGALQGQFSTDALSYEGPFGVGYLVARLHEKKTA